MSVFHTYNTKLSKAFSVFLTAIAILSLFGIKADAFAFTDKLPSSLTALSGDQLESVMEAKTFKDSSGTELPYRIYVPTDYVSEKEYPLVIYFHDDIYNGSDNVKQLSGVTPMSYLLTEEYSKAFEPIIIAPQCAEGYGWVDADSSKGNYLLDKTPVSKYMKAVTELIYSLSGSYNFDVDGQIVFGDGSGGTAVWDYAMRNNSNVAFAAPSGGVGDITKAYMFQTMYVWMFHGKQDEVVPIAYAKELYDAIAAVFPENFLGSFYDASHDVSAKKYVEDEIYYMAFSNVLYQKTEYKIDISCGENGKVTGDTTVKYAQTAEFVISPDTGYTVDKVFVDGVERPASEVASGKFKIYYVREDHILHVTFKEREEVETVADVASSKSKYIVIAGGALVVVAIVALVVSDIKGKGKKNYGA